MKKKIQIEYTLRPASSAILWSAISTPSGLQRWFADDVIRKDKTYIFRWGKTETREAELTNSRSDSYMRFHWTDDEPRTFFEIKIHRNELTNDHSIEVTDFADEGEEDDLKNLWDSQIEDLRRLCGV